MKLSAKHGALIALIAAAVSLRSADDYPALHSIPFDQPGQYEFRFRQAHSREMTLLLDIHGESDRSVLEHLRTTIEMTLTSHAGRTVCKAVGMPGEGVTANSWVLRVGAPHTAAYWHNGCSEIKLKRSEMYTLTIRIRDVDPKTPKISVTPIFERCDDFGP